MLGLFKKEIEKEFFLGVVNYTSKLKEHTFPSIIKKCCLIKLFKIEIILE